MRYAALALLLLAQPAIACDWTVTTSTDPMTDVVTCKVYSPTAKVQFYRDGKDRPNVAVASAYTRHGLEIRVDDNEAIWMGYDARTRQRALDRLLPQIETGKRIRVSFRDYPKSQVGDAMICDLPKLLAACVP
jgi:hypothetical protein